MLKDPSRSFVEPHDPTPIAKPLRLKIPSQSERVMAYVRLEQMRAQQAREVESFEEADDFEFDDGEEWFSPYEEIFEAAPESSPPPPRSPAPAAPSPPSPAGETPPPTAS